MQKETTIKAYMETNDYKQKRENLQREINEKKINIDRKCFAKTPEEKINSKLAKSEYKKSIK